MVTPKKGKAEKFWDRTALTYDQEEGPDEKIYLQIIERVRDYLKATDVVLDFGCGTGSVTNRMASSVKQVYAIDLSSEMIKIARRKAKSQKVTNVEYVQSTIFSDALKPNTYDVILGLYVLHLLEEPEEVLQRIRELLKPGGVLISVTPCMGENSFFAGTFLSMLSKIGIVPPVRSFKSRDLEDLLGNEMAEILAFTKLEKTSNQYFIVAKK